MGTRTYTGFFTDDSVAGIRAEFAHLLSDWEQRVPFIDPEIAEQGTDRLRALELAIKRLTDRAD